MRSDEPLLFRSRRTPRRRGHRLPFFSADFRLAADPRTTCNSGQATPLEMRLCVALWSQARRPLPKLALFKRGRGGTESVAERAADQATSDLVQDT